MLDIILKSFFRAYDIIVSYRYDELYKLNIDRKKYKNKKDTFKIHILSSWRD